MGLVERRDESWWYLFEGEIYSNLNYKVEVEEGKKYMVGGLDWMMMMVGAFLYLVYHSPLQYTTKPNHTRLISFCQSTFANKQQRWN